MHYYKIIDGNKYDANLLDQAGTLAEGQGDGRISHSDAQALVAAMGDGPGTTTVERNTIIYLLAYRPWTEKARQWVIQALGISMEELVRFTHNAPGYAPLARKFYEDLAAEFWAARYQNQRKGLEQDADRWDAYEVDRLGGHLPKPVAETVRYYIQQVEEKDFGGVRLYQLSLDDSLGPEATVFAVQTTTDGDDGWVELYDHQGQPLGFGRTYIELVAWGDKAIVRDFVESGGFPPALEDRMEKTLWGK